jgi:hypothetical protein
MFYYYMTKELKIVGITPTICTSTKMDVGGQLGALANVTAGNYFPAPFNRRPD